MRTNPEPAGTGDYHFTISHEMLTENIIHKNSPIMTRLPAMSALHQKGKPVSFIVGYRTVFPTIFFGILQEPVQDCLSGNGRFNPRALCTL
jgi:hypothetical protein